MKSRLAWCLVWLVLSAGFSPAGAENTARALDGVLEPSIWGLDKADVFDALRGDGFRWVSQDENELRASNVRLSYLQLPVLEAVVRFKDGKPSEVFLSLYNRGDAGEISEEAYEAFVERCTRLIDGRAGGEGVELGDLFKRNTIRSASTGWMAADMSYRLDRAYSRVKEAGGHGREERPEFVNLTLLSGGRTRDELQPQREADTALVNFADRVVRTNDDAVIQGIPMVDQGQKGYCAVATMERIMRYYGSEVNQHELAQQANSSGEGGTDPDSLVDALESMGRKVGLKVDVKERFDFKDFLDMVGDYNKQAKRDKKREIDLPRSGTIYIDQVYAAMDPGVLREVKLKRKSKVDDFLEDIKGSIDEGYPAAWSVMLGLVQEEPKLPQAGGGHMRLITGYNEKKREILYSDSWGYGHEQKRMTLDDAYLITTGLYVVEPR